MEISFIKLRVDMFDDEKIKIIERMQDGILVIYVWVRLLALAGKKNEGGYIIIFPGIPTSVEHIASIMDKPVGIIAQAVNILKQTGLISVDEDNGYWYVTNWEKHQSIDRLEKIRQQNNERKQRFRLNQKQKMLPENAKGNVPVTFRNATEEEEDNKKEDKRGERAKVTHSHPDLLIKYNPSSLTNEEKKHRMTQMYNVMRADDRIDMLREQYSVTREYMVNNLSRWIKDRYLSDDAHHCLNDYWFFFTNYLKKTEK